MKNSLEIIFNKILIINLHYIRLSDFIIKNFLWKNYAKNLKKLVNHHKILFKKGIAILIF